MSGAFFEYDLKSVNTLASLLKGMELSSSDRLRLMKSIGAEVVEQTQDRIEHTKTDPDGNTWADISEKTKKVVEKGSTLFRSQMLFMSIDAQVQDEWSVLVGSAMEYAAVHQYGFEKKNIPQRAYLGLSPENTADLADMVSGWLREHIK